MKLHVVVCSTRPGRKGPAIARWFADVATQEGSFEVELVDLADFALPIFDEPHHPRLQKYEHEHTKRWSAKVAEADAFVFVTPEYNYNPPPSFVNAVDYLVNEWAYKPAAFVSYGGISGGLRAVQSAKLLLTTLKVMPLPDGVVLSAFGQQIEGETFTAKEANVTAAKATLVELQRWAGALKPLRAAS
jgi:NAD(P)H-dependent FMN reductase